jgi:hypothetical protein
VVSISKLAIRIIILLYTAFKTKYSLFSSSYDLTLLILVDYTTKHGTINYLDVNRISVKDCFQCYTGLTEILFRRLNLFCCRTLGVTFHASIQRVTT